MNKEAYVIKKLTSNYIGDDAAVVGERLYSMDAFFEGVHFKREWMSLAQIARKAMLVNLSDAIAMSAQPLYALVTLSLPASLQGDEIDEIVEALHATAGEFGCEIIGGDTIVGKRLDFSITIISSSDQPLLRKGLEVGDLLAYTGVLGESKRDLERLFRGEQVAVNSRFIAPTLRQAFVANARPYLRVGMDISDGLFCDTNKLLDHNGLGFEPLVEIDKDVGSSGEEYEMLIGFSPDLLGAILRIAKETNTPLNLFAKVTSNQKRYPCLDHHM